MTEFASSRYQCLRDDDYGRVMLAVMIFAAMVTGVLIWRFRSYFLPPDRPRILWLGMIGGVFITITAFVSGMLLWWNGALDTSAPLVISAKVLDRSSSATQASHESSHSYLLVSSPQLGATPLTLIARTGYLNFSPKEGQWFPYVQPGAQVAITVGSGALGIPWIRDVEHRL
ncbi:MAG: hypothetical protein HY352_02085 [Candidatus Omnitrophica bacterium]|nr:hypothetical protein [Candidatus Omnitrophota bacterium]